MKPWRGILWNKKAFNIYSNIMLKKNWFILLANVDQIYCHDASSWEIISQTNSISVHVNIFYWWWTPLIVHPFHPRRVKLVDRVKSGEQLDMILARWAWGGYVNQSPRGGCGAGVIIAPRYGQGRGCQGDCWEIICHSKLKLWILEYRFNVAILARIPSI